MFVWIAIGIGAVCVFAAAVLIFESSKTPLKPFRFYLAAKKRGLNRLERREIYKLLAAKKVKRPERMFKSAEFLNMAISEISQAGYNKPAVWRRILLEKLYKLRGGLENAKLYTKKRKNYDFSSTRKIRENQQFSIEAGGSQPVKAVLLENSDLLLLQLLEEPEHVGRVVNVYFWRNGEGYGFQSIIAQREGLKIWLPHSDALLKRQRRAHVRAEAGFPAEFFLAVKGQEHSYQVENKPGFACTVKDISEGGAALVAEGRGQVNLAIKVQFLLEGKKIVMCGEVKGVSYDAQANHSTLHLQADENMPFEMREPILAYIYKIHAQKAK